MNEKAPDEYVLIEIWNDGFAPCAWYAVPKPAARTFSKPEAK